MVNTKSIKAQLNHDRANELLLRCIEDLQERLVVLEKNHVISKKGLKHKEVNRV